MPRTRPNPACPAFFRASIHEAKSDTSDGYMWAGYSLAIHALEYVNEIDGAREALIDTVSSRTCDAREWEIGALKWFDRYLPSCMALVPKRRRVTFAKGIQLDHDEDLLLQE